MKNNGATASFTSLYFLAGLALQRAGEIRARAVKGRFALDRARLPT
ncbi:MAG TPA: hypothetical protein VLN08_03545 [Vicinamibacterales bacterium]|nr:hypothetical protein [Vicinamibacterales bacterium]